jgi:hypothetical protein
LKPHPKESLSIPEKKRLQLCLLESSHLNAKVKSGADQKMGSCVTTKPHSVFAVAAPLPQRSRKGETRAVDLINSLLKLLNSDSTLSAWRPRHYIPILRQPAAQRPEQQMTKSIVTAHERDENILKPRRHQRTHKPIYLFIINALSIAAQFFAPRAPH